MNLIYKESDLIEFESVNYEKWHKNYQTLVLNKEFVVTNIIHNDDHIRFTCIFELYSRSDTKIYFEEFKEFMTKQKIKEFLHE